MYICQSSEQILLSVKTLVLKVLKSIGLPSGSKNTAKICLKDSNNELFFEPKETSNIFKDFYENLAQSLVDKLPTAPNKFNLGTTKTFYEQMNIAKPLGSINSQEF